MKDIRKNRYVRYLAYKYREIRGHFSYRIGKNNTIVNNGVKLSTKSQIIGDNNHVVIEDGALVKNTLIHITGSNNRIVLKEGSYVSKAELWIEDNNCEIIIGKRTFIGPAHIAAAENNSKVIIGDDCMIGLRVQIRTSDSHSILSDGKRVNYADPISIGNHVWICPESKIMKGVHLSDDTIVSTGTVVTRDFGPNVLLGGVPAKVIKENVNWDEKRL